MTAVVHFFAFAGLTTGPVVSGERYSTDSVQFFKEPILGRAKLTADSSTPVATQAADSPGGTFIASLQVQPGKAVYYEVTPANVDTLIPASDTSRYGSGNFSLPWGPGWRLSVLEKV